MADLDDYAGESLSEPDPAQQIDAPTDDAAGVLEQLRSASFATGRRGYDRRQVDEFLSRIARRIEVESSAFDPDVVKRRLQEVGESTAGILTAAEETARKLQTDASSEAERLRSEARQFAETAREKATEETQRLRTETTRRSEEIMGAAETRAEELLEQSLERRRVLDATIERLVDRRAQISNRLRDLSAELRDIADEGSEVEDETTDEAEPVADPWPRREAPDFEGDDEETSVRRAPGFDSRG